MSNTYTSERLLKEHLDIIEHWALQYREDKNKIEALQVSNSHTLSALLSDSTKKTLFEQTARHNEVKMEFQLAIGDLLADIEGTARERQECDIDADATFLEFERDFSLYLFGICEELRNAETGDEQTLFHILDITSREMYYHSQTDKNLRIYGQDCYDLIADLLQ